MDEALDSLAPEEQDRAREFRFEPDRRRYLGGTFLQRLVLVHYLSYPIRDLSFSRNQWGKPSLDQRHDSTIQFSLSRSHELAILAVTGASQIGADLEYALGRNNRDLSAKNQFSPEEQSFIENAPNPTNAFFEIWTRKEAYLKAIGHGLSHPLSGFDVTPNGPTGEMTVRDWSNDTPKESWRVRSINLPEDGYTAAISTPILSHSIELIEIGCNELLARASQA